MCVKVTVIRNTEYASLSVSFCIHDEIFNKQSFKSTGYILPKTLLMDTVGQMETTKNVYRIITPIGVTIPEAV